MNPKIQTLILLGQWRLESNLNFAPGWWTQSIEQQEGDSSETSNRLCLHSANDRCHPFRSQVGNNNTTCYGSCRSKTWRNTYTLAVCLWYSHSRFIPETSVCYLHPHFRRMSHGNVKYKTLVGWNPHFGLPAYLQVFLQMFCRTIPVQRTCQDVGNVKHFAQR